MNEVFLKCITGHLGQEETKSMILNLCTPIFYLGKLKKNVEFE